MSGRVGLMYKSRNSVLPFSQIIPDGIQRFVFFTASLTTYIDYVMSKGLVAWSDFSSVTNRILISETSAIGTDFAKKNQFDLSPI